MVNKERTNRLEIKIQKPAEIYFYNSLIKIMMSQIIETPSLLYPYTTVLNEIARLQKDWLVKQLAAEASETTKRIGEMMRNYASTSDLQKAIDGLNAQLRDANATKEKLLAKVEMLETIIKEYRTILIIKNKPL